MSERTFRLHDTTISVCAQSGRTDRVMNWQQPDYETFNRIVHALEAKGFTFGKDPWIDRQWPSLNKGHRLGERATPAGSLFVTAETYPTGCKFEFFQEVVTENRNGGRFDFDKRAKMPYLIGKAFEVALGAMCAHLVERGFGQAARVDSANPDPLAYFNARWDGDYERSRGVHRFKRDASGWPDASELRYWGQGYEPAVLEQGSTWYFRDYGGHLMRGRAYGGINGMWMVVFGPGARDFTHLARFQLFQCDPSRTPRRVHPRGAKRLQEELTRAVGAQDFERAITLRDQLKAA